jgi:hypothetical protein
MKRAALLCALVWIVVACVGELPARYVIERDLGGFHYRRYQRTLGAELEVAGNPAQGHTATYLQRGRERVAVATAFVSVHARAASLVAETRERLSTLSRYRTSVQPLGGQYAFILDAGPDERWAVWVSGRHVVKLGAPHGGSFPGELVAAYLDAYPSDLDEHGRARPDASSRGPSADERARIEQQDRELPRQLRENAPR